MKNTLFSSLVNILIPGWHIYTLGGKKRKRGCLCMYIVNHQRKGVYVAFLDQLVL